MISVIGTNFKFHDTHERFQIGKFLKNVFNNEIKHGIMLETCNRSELYFNSDDNISLFDKIPFGYIKHGQKVIEHLLKVLCGLDSALLGENEIVNQVKKAYQYSHENNLLNKKFHKIFQKAFFYSKKIRNESNIKLAGISYANHAVNWIKNNLNNKDSKILIFGTGSIAKEVIKHCKNANLLSKVTLTSSRQHLLDKFRNSYGISTVFRSNVYEIFDEYSAIITATKAPHPVLLSNHIKNKKILKKMIICDISATGNVEKKLIKLFKKGIDLDYLINDINHYSYSFDFLHALKMINCLTKRINYNY